MKPKAAQIRASVGTILIKPFENGVEDVFKGKFYVASSQAESPITAAEVVDSSKTDLTKGMKVFYRRKSADNFLVEGETFAFIKPEDILGYYEEETTV